MVKRMMGVARMPTEEEKEREVVMEEVREVARKLAPESNGDEEESGNGEEDEARRVMM
jgi:hypothetical protein